MCWKHQIFNLINALYYNFKTNKLEKKNMIKDNNTNLLKIKIKLNVIYFILCRKDRRDI